MVGFGLRCDIGYKGCWLGCSWSCVLGVELGVLGMAMSVGFGGGECGRDMCAQQCMFGVLW